MLADPPLGVHYRGVVPLNFVLSPSALPGALPQGQAVPPTQGGAQLRAES